MFTSADSAVAVAGVPFQFTASTTCPALVLISAQGLPPGLALADHLASCTATISGVVMPRQDGVHPVALSASAAAASTAQHLALTVASPPVLRARSVVNARVGLPVFSIVTASGFPVPTIQSSALPAGVSLVAGANGSATLEGTPNPGAGGAYLVTITASNGILVPATAPLHLTIDEAPTITGAPASLSVTAGAPMAPLTVAAAGYPTPAISALGLPAGLSLVDHLNGTATVAGTPTGTVGRTTTVTLRARNRAGTSTQGLVLSVSP